MVNVSSPFRRSFPRLRGMRRSAKSKIARSSGQCQGSGIPSVYHGKMPFRYASRTVSTVKGVPNEMTSCERKRYSPISTQSGYLYVRGSGKLFSSTGRFYRRDAEQMENGKLKKENEGEFSTFNFPFYTVLSFHLPRLNSNPLAIASRENASVMAQNTPSGPILKRYASA